MTDQFNSRLETDEKRMHELKDSSGGITQNAAESRAKTEKTKKQLRDMERGGLKEIQTMMCNRSPLELVEIWILGP